MNGELLPWKILSHNVGVGVLTEGWNLDESSSDGESDEARVFTLPVNFDAPFENPPVVSLGLTGFDMDQGTSGRVSLKAVDISAFGFTVQITTWRDTRVFAVEFAWLAVGA